jgi:hypothetical protein
MCRRAADTLAEGPLAGSGANRRLSLNDMDEVVLRAIAKWPDVPAVYGWLSLDRRGRWLIKGAPITNPTMTAFIARNYEADDEGRWFFQNGPQRVFVELAYTPFIYFATLRGDTTLELKSHTGRGVDSIDEGWIDETGSVLLRTPVGIGIVYDRDLPIILDCMVTSTGEPPQELSLQITERAQKAGVRLRFGDELVDFRFINSSDVPGQFGFDPAPRPLPGQPEC